MISKKQFFKRGFMALSHVAWIRVNLKVRLIFNKNININQVWMSSTVHSTTNYWISLWVKTRLCWMSRPTTCIHVGPIYLTAKMLLTLPLIACTNGTTTCQIKFKTCTKKKLKPALDSQVTLDSFFKKIRFHSCAHSTNFKHARQCFKIDRTRSWKTWRWR